MAPLAIQQTFDLALQHHRAGRLQEAERLYRQILVQEPNHADAMCYLGLIFGQLGRYDIAASLIGNAINLRPNHAQSHYNLSVALAGQGRLDEASAACRQAIALRPDYAEAYNNLGNALHDKGELDEAVAAYRQAIALNPSFADAYHNLGNALRNKGELDGAIASYRQALGQGIDNAGVHSNLVFTLYFHPAHDARSIAEEHRRWNLHHAEPLRRFIQPHSNDPNPNRRLRIGYVSPDFRAHCQSYFTIPLLAHHDRDQFEVYCYANVLRPDEFTDRLRNLADPWRNTVGMSNPQIADLVRTDRIDILIDLTMHMGNGRLLLFARKPAPVQVAWLAYPGTTGLSTIDYRLTDPYLDPPGHNDEHYSEKSIRLPDTFWCYRPMTVELEINPLPALTASRITFGCLNNFCKLNDGVLTLWARVLQQVEGSRLLLLAPQGTCRQRAVDRLSQEGIDPGRIEFVSHQPRQTYLEHYHRLDVGLDSFPYNGHTTSLDSFWMGVPVITLVGARAVSRAGWCLLSNLGLTELAAQTPEQFVRIAVELAKDVPRLQELRSTLRRRMEQSPLMDAPRFARNVEAAYRQMWRNWCETAG
jgi:predicted O-linked N-acetylglucosamine transferase (SPINDLY family)